MLKNKYNRLGIIDRKFQQLNIERNLSYFRYVDNEQWSIILKKDILQILGPKKFEFDILICEEILPGIKISIEQLFYLKSEGEDQPFNIFLDFLYNLTDRFGYYLFDDVNEIGEIIPKIKKNKLFEALRRFRTYEISIEKKDILERQTIIEWLQVLIHKEFEEAREILSPLIKIVKEKNNSTANNEIFTENKVFNNLEKAINGNSEDSIKKRQFNRIKKNLSRWFLINYDFESIISNFNLYRINHIIVYSSFFVFFIMSTYLFFFTNLIIKKPQETYLTNYFLIQKNPIEIYLIVLFGGFLIFSSFLKPFKFIFIEKFNSRIFAGVLIGYTLLGFKDEVWGIAFRISWLIVVIIIISSFTLSYLFARMELEKRPHRLNFKTKIKKRNLVFIVLYAFLLSMVVGIIMSSIIGEHIVSTIHEIEYSTLKETEYSRVSYEVFSIPKKVYLKIFGYNITYYRYFVLFYFPIASLLGVFLELAWEEKPITESF